MSGARCAPAQLKPLLRLREAQFRGTAPTSGRFSSVH
jgi:hypothetical protein